MNIEEIGRARRITDLYDKLNKVEELQGRTLTPPFDVNMWDALGDDFTLFQKEMNESYSKIVERHLEFRKTKLKSMLEELVK